MMNLAENALLTAARQDLVAAGILRWPAIRKFAAGIKERFDVRAPGVDAPARSLSGGNLQKFILGREIAQRPAVLVLAYPTWGVDVGAATAIHQAIMDLRAEGTAVLIVSEDLDELFELSDRIAVIAAGRLSAAFENGAVGVEELGLLMAGADPGAETGGETRAT
jgi:simple sugar transport system ATP-binding protein